MTYVNHYTAPPSKNPRGLAGLVAPHLPDSELYGPTTPYDINFAYPLHEDTLQNERVKLVPFIPAVHAPSLEKQITGASYKELFRYYPILFTSLADLLALIEVDLRRKPHSILFAVIDKTRAEPGHADWGGALAGIIGMFGAPRDLMTSFGFVVVLPAFQRTHVAKDMAGLLLRYALQLPSASPPGLGLRRVQWSAQAENTRSIALAERLGFRSEGVTRWQRILPPELNEVGKKPREGDEHEGQYGSDSVMLAVCWDDWERGVREQVAAIVGE